MKLDKKFVISLLLAGILLISMNVNAINITNEAKQDENIEEIDGIKFNKIISNNLDDDIDPLVELEINITIKEIRAFDKIDKFGDPDFYVVLIVNGEKYQSPIWKNQKHVTEEWSQIIDVPDDVENVNITIQLWDWNILRDKLCDLSTNNEAFRKCYDVDLQYNLKIGHWFGQDFIYPSVNWRDYSGYGRLNGCDDNSIYEKDRDCELFFDIKQNDFDEDGIPYWTEVNVYNTDPQSDDTGRDDDEDGVPIEWEYKWGSLIYYNWHHETYEFWWFFDPFVWEDHKNIDIDNDGLNNVEEYMTSEWGSDPFRKDIFVEMDWMEEGPNGEPESIFPQGSIDLLKEAFNRQNIMIFIDNGYMGGGEKIKFAEENDRDDLVQIYRDYFLHGDDNNWRKSAFHYGVVVYNADYGGYMFGTNDNYAGAFQISYGDLYRRAILKNPLERRINVLYASAYMHELGHTLQINIPGGHDQDSTSPWQINWWKWRPYKSCMNYGYTYFLVDYSDGSHGKNDHDDWSNLDLKAFQSWDI